MVALEALACGTSVLASDTLHSLPSQLETATLGDTAEWIGKIESHQPESSIQIPNMHRIEAVKETLASLYSSKLSMSSTSG